MPGLYIQGEPDKSIEGPRRLDHLLTHVVFDLDVKIEQVYCWLWRTGERVTGAGWGFGLSHFG